MTNEETREVLQQIRNKKCVSKCDYGCKLYESENFCLEEKALDMAIKALEQTELNSSYNGVKSELEPCEDCISREAVIKIFGEVHPMDYNTQAYITNIQNLPSVTPSRPKGKLIDILDEKTELTETHHTECSICGAEVWEEFKYCPKCGAKMEVKE